MKDQPTVAVIGGGIAGLTAAYVLRATHQVTLLEADDRLGGHADTHDVAIPDGSDLAVDSGFIVHNDQTYPVLLRLFAELDVPTQATEMSMSITCERCGLSYAGGRGVSGVFAQPRRIADRRFRRMLTQVPRFHRAARRELAVAAHSVAGGGRTWGEFLEEERFDPYFVQHYALPLVSCVWSAGHEDARAYPARHLFQFLEHHGMLSLTGSPSWRTVTGGSRAYVERVAAALAAAGAQVRTGLAGEVRSLRRGPDGVEVTTAEGQSESFDQAVLATHADIAGRILLDATDEEARDLAAIKYSSNPTLLHTDSSVLPTVRGAKASWNYRLSGCDQADEGALVSYWMNRLHDIDPEVGTDFVVTLNAEDSVDPQHVIARRDYAHPIFTHEAVEAATRLREAGGPQLAFAGAHLGWGFHEDGARSGLAAATRLGGHW